MTNVILLTQKNRPPSLGRNFIWTMKVYPSVGCPSMTKSQKFLERKANSMIDGAKLKELRELAGMSTEQLGDYAGVSGSAIRHTERGIDKLGLKPLSLIAEKLGVTVDDLIKKKGA